MSGQVRFERVWKKFRRGERHDSLRDLIPALGRALAGRRRGQGLEREEFWAVEDASFAVAPGEALGIIGPNGAGKSTILKILTRLLKPTHGRAEVVGRVGSLLEIGGSLHPDLTGRENVYLQGSIMGMRRAEIARKFDEIVAFAGVAEFIDTPVKRYSSGMHARLGFSVAAHLETDVLIIDEVLAVGDASFQRKAFDRMEAMVTRGVPTIVVSHQLERIATLCTHALLLNKGRIVFLGEPLECIAAYARLQSATDEEETAEDAIRLDAIALDTAQPVPSGGPVRVLLRGAAPAGVTDNQTIALRVRSLQTGHMIYATNTSNHGIELREGPFELALELQMNVAEGMYSIESVVGRWPRERDLRNGPATLVHVTGGPSFWGTVQLHGALRLTSGDAQRRAAGG